MSRFFKGSDSESESSSTDEEINIPQKPAVTAKAFQFSDDEEETRRVVRSAKDKRFEELRTIIKQLRNKKNIKDMCAILSDFENLGKAFEKAKKVVDKEGVPRFYVKILVELDDFINECWEDRDGRKQMSKNNAKGLTTLRQKLKKYNRDFEQDIILYREDPDVGDEDEGDEDGEDEASEEEGEEEVSVPTFKKAEPKPQTLDDGEDSDEYWNMSSGEESSSSEEEGPAEFTAAYFLKKESDKKEVKKKPKKEKEKRSIKKDENEENDEGGEWEEVTKGMPAPIVEKPKMFAKDTEVNHEAVCKKLVEIVSARGKKATDRNEQIELLKELLTIAETNNLGAGIAIKVRFNIVAAIFDYNSNIATCMRPEMWEMCLSYVTALLDLLTSNPDIIASEHVHDESENLQTTPYRIRGCVLTVVERMDEEFIKMLQACDAHSTEYVERLKDEKTIYEIIKRLQEYLEDRATTEEICRIYLHRIEHTYYKCDFSLAKENVEEDSEKLMDRLCKYIYAKDVTDRLRTRAILCHIYHHALHDRWFQARDLMLMSHLQDTIHHSDVPTQLLYNRTMVQLGLCSFRCGFTKDAHNALVDIQSGGRAKELLAQGLLLQRQHERTPEQEKIEKRRLLPYHMHINLELLECVYLVSAMLMEIPYMAAHEMDARRRMISKNFHHVLRMAERQTLTGPPESMREHVVAASRAMKTGDWKACKNFVINEKMNTKVWNLFPHPDRVRDMITSKIQEESLRTYLFTYSSVYDSLSLHTLAEMFELEKQVVHSTISKMIINEELMASLDEPTQCVIMHRTEPTRLQSLALQLSEKVGNLVENNERITEIKQGNLFYQKGNRDRDQMYQQNQQNWNRRQNRQQQRAY
ncbi:hypothetical protein CHS0354_025344 [Potamilus streckersoni]|uniref:Eukaryotic translation initiation factor 3 subunit C n=1 Tax=Potamilus streckersoni TaxID=2493646 RepID=A0AAE0SPN1_9BIVA|nr:hypothetical protein CHS0354_025344 [Potamilus streckersoni]